MIKKLRVAMVSIMSIALLGINQVAMASENQQQMIDILREGISTYSDSLNELVNFGGFWDRKRWQLGFSGYHSPFGKFTGYDESWNIFDQLRANNNSLKSQIIYSLDYAQSELNKGNTENVSIALAEAQKNTAYARTNFDIAIKIASMNFEDATEIAYAGCVQSGALASGALTTATGAGLYLSMGADVSAGWVCDHFFDKTAGEMFTDAIQNGFGSVVGNVTGKYVNQALIKFRGQSLAWQKNYIFSSQDAVLERLKGIYFDDVDSYQFAKKMMQNDLNITSQLMTDQTREILHQEIAGINFISGQIGGQSTSKVFDYFQNTDLYGGDYLMKTNISYDACLNACLGDNKCNAFTYNQNVNACFLKNSSYSKTPYNGAVSGISR